MKDSQILDLVIGVLDQMDPGNFEQIAQELQDYEIMGTLLEKDKLLTQGGRGIERRMMTKTAGSFRHTSPYEDDVINIVDLLKKMIVRWVHATANWAFETGEILQCADGKTLVNNIVKPREIGTMIDIAQGLESDFFNTYDADDEQAPYGLKYWLTKGLTDGFTGGSPTGDDMVANVDLTKVLNFMNWYAQYSAVTEDDFVDKLDKAFYKTNWKQPVKSPNHSKERRLRFYTNYTLRRLIVKQSRRQNQDLGPDIGALDGETVYKKIPFKAIPALDTDSTNPLYGIDMGTFGAVVLKGDYLRRSDPMPHPTKHRVKVVHIDLTYNYACVNRRRNFVLSL